VTVDELDNESTECQQICSHSARSSAEHPDGKVVDDDGGATVVVVVAKVVLVLLLLLVVVGC
jgi:hypothetical protein